MMDIDTVRIRKVLKLAAKQTKVRALRDWILCDEFGKFEEQASKMLAHADKRAPDINATEAEVDAAVATEIVLSGALAMVKAGKTRP